MNANNKIKCASGHELKRTLSTIYLGTEINAAADPTLEVQRRMAEVCVTWKKLDTFWKHSNTPTKVKIQVYDAVIRSKLVYGLESLQLTKAWQSRINAFQLKGLRKILKSKSTYIDRRQTNAKIYDTCTRLRCQNCTANEIWTICKITGNLHVSRVPCTAERSGHRPP